MLRINSTVNMVVVFRFCRTGRYIWRKSRSRDRLPHTVTETSKFHSYSIDFSNSYSCRFKANRMPFLWALYVLFWYVVVYGWVSSGCVLENPTEMKGCAFQNGRIFREAAHVRRRSRMRKTVFRQQDCTVFAGLSGNGRSGVPGRRREIIVFD